MDAIIDIARTHFVPPWLLHGPILAFVFSMIFPVFGTVMAIRGFVEHKLYLTPYLGFWLGEGIFFSFIQVLGSIVLDGHTPQAIYTELWFELLLCVPTFVVSIGFLKGIAKDAESKNRPKEASGSPSEKYHLHFGFPTGALLTILVVIWSILADGLFRAPLWVYIVGVVVGVAWGYILFYIDANREIPQNMQQWYGRIILGVMVLVICLPPAFSFVT